MFGERVILSILGALLLTGDCQMDIVGRCRELTMGALEAPCLPTPATPIIRVKAT